MGTVKRVVEVKICDACGREVPDLTTYQVGKERSLKRPELCSDCGQTLDDLLTAVTGRKTGPVRLVRSEIGAPAPRTRRTK